MFNSFPYDEWSETVTDGFLDVGGANSTGTYILTVLGCILMVASLIGFVWLEKGKLERQAERFARRSVRCSPRLRRPHRLHRPHREEQTCPSRSTFRRCRRKSRGSRRVHARPLYPVHHHRRDHPQHRPRGPVHRAVGVVCALNGSALPHCVICSRKQADGLLPRRPGGSTSGRPGSASSVLTRRRRTRAGDRARRPARVTEREGGMTFSARCRG